MNESKPKDPRDKDRAGSQTPTVLSKEYLEAVAERARRIGFISLDELVYIMAGDDQYVYWIPKLWDEYQLWIRGPKQPDSSSRRKRIAVWQALLYRFALGTVSAVEDGLQPIPYLPLYTHNPERGKFERNDRVSLSKGPAYIRLKELSDYLTQTITIPLPLRLFKEKTGYTQTRQKQKPSQRHRIECRKVARSLWSKDPSITIADMMMRDEIAIACERELYSEVTLRRWINDLCPNRRPGRRPIEKK